MTLAAAFARARLAGRAAEISGLARPADPADAYLLQDEMTAALCDRVVGWKLGATSQQSQKALKASEPFYGPLFARFDFASGAAAPTSPAHSPGAEVEFAFVVGRRLAPRAAPYTRADIAAAIERFVPAIEIAGTRVPGGIPAAGGPLLLIADGGANCSFIRGAAAGDWRGADLDRHPCRLLVDGREAAAGSGSLALGHPLDALAWFANALSRRDRALEAGQVVTTGTCTGFIPVAPGQTLVGDFGSLGRVEARLTAW